MKSYKIANSRADLTFSREGLAEVSAGGRDFCIAEVNHKLFCCSAKCPHAGGTLSEGYTDIAGNIVCPLHCYKFSLVTGRNVSGEDYHLKTYAIDEKPEGIFIEMPDFS